MLRRIVALLACVALASSAAPARKPNVLLIVADDLGYAELSCQGSRDLRTPNIDSLARFGVRFTSGYVSAPVCCPSRAGLLTGRYQTRFGHEHNAIGLQNLEPGIGLPREEKTLADLLRAEGYAAGLVGKWHLGATKPFHPRHRGFDEFYGFLHEGHFYAPPPYDGMVSWFRVRSLPEGAVGPRWRQDNLIFSTHMGNTEPMYDRENPILRGFDEAGPEHEYLTDALGREAEAFIRRHAAEPWFLYLAYNAPHSPLQATRDWFDRMVAIADVQRRIFAAMVGSLDESVGRVLGALRTLGLEENTLVVFFSDNGGPTRELTSSNRPLRGGKGSLYEGGIRVPFLIQWKGRVPAGVVYDLPVISLDVAPTALAAAGARIPENLDGVDLVPFLRGDRAGAPHETLYWRYGDRYALRQARWKLVRNGAAVELYNLRADMGEQRDLAADNAAAAKRLQAEWEHRNAEMTEPRWRSKGSGAVDNWPLEFVRKR